jgi:hypothetical protein
MMIRGSLCHPALERHFNLIGARPDPAFSSRY